MPSAHKLWGTICAKNCLLVLFSLLCIQLSLMLYKFLLSMNIMQCILDIMVNNRMFRVASPSCLKPKMKPKDYRLI